MEPRPLGASGLSISPVILGAQAFARHDPAERVRILHAAIDAGITSIDTAPLYAFGESERLVGQAIAGRRHAVQVLSKVGLRWDDEHGEVLLSTTDDAGNPRVVRRDSRPAAVRRDVEQSLGRLGVEALDLCQVHHPDPLVPIADTMGELLRLREEGKLHAIGVSNFSAEQIEQARRALGQVPLASVQSEYSLLQRKVERELLGACVHHEVGVLAYSPLKQGLLAGCMAGGRRLGLDDYRRFDPLFHPVNVARVEAVRRGGMESLARRHGVSTAQVALAWVLHQPGVVGVIAGGSSVAQVRANARAAEVTLRAGDRAGLEAEFGRVHLDLELAPRRRDRLRDRVDRVEQRAARAWRRVGRRLPWLPAWPGDR